MNLFNEMKPYLEQLRKHIEKTENDYFIGNSFEELDQYHNKYGPWIREYFLTGR